MTDLKLGMIGVSDGNGHPYSFSSIINGYSEAGLANAGWEVIYDYVSAKDPSEIGFDDATVTHAWTQDEAETRRLCDAALIPNALSSIDDLFDSVDAVIIARDDYENHRDMAIPFLEDGTPVILDKPLAVDIDSLRQFRPYLESGLLLSCSGLRYARELDTPRSHLERYGDIRLLRGTVINDWERYGVHMLDALLEVIDQRPVAVSAREADHDSVAVELDGGTLLQIDALGDVPMTFDVDIVGTERTSRHELRDNFTAFRRTLSRFVDMVKHGSPPIDPDDTLDVMRALIAGRQSLTTGRRVRTAAVEV